MILPVIIFMVLGMYAATITVLVSGFLRTPLFKSLTEPIPVNIIVCARNEEKSIARCITTILGQEYPGNLVNLIIINDASTDQTVAQAELALRGSGFSHRIISNNIQKGKKASITYAMQLVQNGLVIVRDADTYTQSNSWLQTLVSCHVSSGAEFIIAPVALGNNVGLLWAMQAVENNVLALLACGAAHLGHPFLANGANMAFTSRCFESVNGFESHRHIASGDDVLFLEEVRKKGGHVVYAKSTDATVFTYPAYSLGELFKQKIRWASKFRHQKSYLNFSLAVLTFLVNATWLACPVIVYIDPHFKTPALLFIFLKLFIDIMLLFLSSSLLNNKKLGWFALPVGCLYPVYATIVSFGALFVKPKWK